MNTVIVTRHPAMVDYLREIGLVDKNQKVEVTTRPRVTAKLVSGNHVIGDIPLRFMAMCAKVTIVSLTIPHGLHGSVLTLEQIRSCAGEPVSYQVKKLPNMADQAVLDYAAELMRFSGDTSSEFKSEVRRVTEEIGRILPEMDPFFVRWNYYMGYCQKG